MKGKYKIFSLIAVLSICTFIFVVGSRLRHEKINYDLHTAAGRGDVVAAEFALDSGADVNSLYPGDGYGWVNAALFGNNYPSKVTPVHIAASRNYVDVVKLLLSKGANPNIENFHGHTALERAEITDATEAVAILKQAEGRTH